MKKNRKKIKHKLTERDIVCLIAVITMGFQAITTLMGKELDHNPYSIIVYGIIAISFSALALSLSYRKKK